MLREKTWKYENIDENPEVGQRTPEDWWQGRPPGCWDAAVGTGCQKNWKCCKGKDLQMFWRQQTQIQIKSKMCNFFTLVGDISPSSLALGEMQDQQQAATLDQPAEFKLIW